MTVSEYDELKRLLVVSVGASEKHGQILHILKEFYKDDIDSLRRFEQITKVGQLLNVLEIRDVLSEEDVGPLKVIARKLPNKGDLLRKITEYEAIRGTHGNSYRSETAQKSSHMQESSSPLNNHPFGTLSNKKKQRIIDTVVEEIGSNWRDLARNLKEIRECTIDDIDSKNNDLESKAAELMEKYEAKADPQRWFFVLCNALERTRRKDLSKTLQNIMAMNI